jgi:hypothetical protein
LPELPALFELCERGTAALESFHGLSRKSFRGY